MAPIEGRGCIAVLDHRADQLVLLCMISHRWRKKQSNRHLRQQIPAGRKFGFVIRYFV
jgi:hypothetical protein